MLLMAPQFASVKSYLTDENNRNNKKNIKE